MSSLAKICDPKTFDMVMKAAARPMIQINVSECYLSLVQDPPPKDDCRREIDTAGEGPASLSGMSCTGTMVWTHLASSCSHLAVPQVQILQWWHGQGSVHNI